MSRVEGIPLCCLNYMSEVAFAIGKRADVLRTFPCAAACRLVMHIHESRTIPWVGKAKDGCVHNAIVTNPNDRYQIENS